MEKSQKVTLLSTIILIGFTLGVIYHYILGYYLHYEEPYNSFLYNSSMAFCDFFGAFPYIQDFKPYQDVTMWVVYFPLAYFIIFPFLFIKNKILAYLIYLSGFVVYLITMNIKSFYCENLTKMQNIQNIFVLSVISYPVLYNLDKGNFDMYLFVLMGFWAYAFKNEKYGLSAFLLAVLNAIKPFSIYFLLLYLLKKRYKEFFFSIILTGILVIGGFMLLPDNFFNQISILLQSLIFFKKVYAYTVAIRNGFCSSMFMPLKAVMLHFSVSVSNMVNFVKIYDIFCYILTLVTLFFVWREKTFWKQLTLLICNFLLTFYCVYDYKLVFLYIPLWFFINQKNKSKFDLAYLLMFAFLFVPKSIIISLPLINNGETNWISLSAIINPIIFSALSLLIIFEQFQNKKSEEVG